MALATIIAAMTRTTVSNNMMRLIKAHPSFRTCNPLLTLANAASVRELTRRLALATAEAGGLRARLELAEAAQAALREDLERERQRADRESARAERERRTSERLEEELRTYRSKGFWERLFGDG